jgi:CheY-like chemotaxis protein
LAELLRVLIIEDTPADADLLVMHLTKENYHLEWKRVESEVDFLAALNTPFDLILSDWVLPRFSGQRAFQLLTERGLQIPLYSHSIAWNYFFNSIKRIPGCIANKSISCQPEKI